MTTSNEYNDIQREEQYASYIVLSSWFHLINVCDFVKKQLSDENMGR